MSVDLVFFGKKVSQVCESMSFARRNETIGESVVDRPVVRGAGQTERIEPKEQGIDFTRKVGEIMIPSKMGSFFEEFQEGEVIHHALSKTVFESDNNFFCLLTMNHHPVHLNAEYASEEQHGKILVVGTLVFSLVVGMTVPDISGKAIANLGYEKVEHLAPVFVNDTLFARSVVLSKRLSTTKQDRGIVKVETYGYNQDRIDVLRLRRDVLIKRGGVESENSI